MPPDPNRQYDLLAFAKAMKAEGRHRRLVDFVEKAVSVCSAHEDLRAAIENLNALRELTRGPQQEDRLNEWIPACAHSLTAHSIILYCRATQTTSNHRRNWFGLEGLNDEQRDLHSSVINLRNDAIAHFGLGEAHPEGPLMREALLLTFEEAGPRPVFHSSWSLNRARFTIEFLLLVEAVREIAFEKARIRMNDMLIEIARAGGEDHSLRSVIESYRFDSNQFFGNQGAQEQVWQRLDEDGVATVTMATPAPFYGREQ